MNLDLLKPFDLEAAQRGEEICLSAGDNVTFVAEAGPNGYNATRDSLGNLGYWIDEYLRMKPLAWVEDRPVYKGDVLYWKYEGLAHYAHHTSSETNTALISDRLTWTKPEPVKKTRTVKFLGFMSDNGRLVMVSEERSNPYCADFKRVPGADVEYEVAE